jgi:acyl dehydratase
MALNQDYEGRVFPPDFSYEVGLEKIREFATAIGDENPAYHDVAAAQALGYSSLVAPPTFAFVVTSRAMSPVIGDPGLGLDYTKVVHGEQRFSYLRPLVAGDRVQVTSTIERLRSAAGNDMVTVRSDVADQTGALVVTTWGTLVARGTA